MRGFMIVIFTFLGFAFYELSGGSEYEPVAHSLQARVAAADRAVPIEMAVLAPDMSGPDDTVAAAQALQDDVASPAETGTDAPHLGITLASAAPGKAAAFVPSVTVYEPAVSEEPVQDLGTRRVFSLETYDAAADRASSAAVLERPDRADIRRVAGTRVNMRAGPGTEFRVLSALTQGTQIAVLEEPGHGWIMFEVLDTGETGWMADWLVAASTD